MGLGCTGKDDAEWASVNTLDHPEWQVINAATIQYQPQLPFKPDINVLTRETILQDAVSKAILIIGSSPSKKAYGVSQNPIETATDDRSVIRDQLKLGNGVNAIHNVFGIVLNPANLPLTDKGQIESPNRNQRQQSGFLLTGTRYSGANLTWSVFRTSHMGDVLVLILVTQDESTNQVIEPKLALQLWHPSLAPRVSVPQIPATNPPTALPTAPPVLDPAMIYTAYTEYTMKMDGLLAKWLQTSNFDAAMQVEARKLTLDVLPKLPGQRSEFPDKSMVLLYLHGNFLITGQNPKVSLAGANFDGAIVQDTDLTDANLSGASFRFANLSGSDFTNAVLDGTDFTGSNLTPAQLAQAASAVGITPPNASSQGTAATTISPQGLLFLGELEGNFHEYAYNDLGDSDPNSKCTIGYGRVLWFRPCTPTEKQIKTTKQQEVVYFTNRTDQDGFNLRQLVQVPLNQHQFDALVAFMYNLGTDILNPGGQDSRLLTLLNNQDFASAVQEMKIYNKQTDVKTGQKVYKQGIQNRRCEESDLFEGGDYVVTYAYCPRAD